MVVVRMHTKYHPQIEGRNFRLKFLAANHQHPHHHQHPDLFWPLVISIRIIINIKTFSLAASHQHPHPHQRMHQDLFWPLVISVRIIISIKTLFWPLASTSASSSASRPFLAASHQHPHHAALCWCIVCCVARDDSVRLQITNYSGTSQWRHRARFHREEGLTSSVD